MILSRKHPLHAISLFLCIHDIQTVRCFSNRFPVIEHQTELCILSHQPYEDEETLLKEIPSTQTEHFESLPRTAAILLAILSAEAVMPAFAVDHPVDNFHFSTPNLIPGPDPRYFLSGSLCAAASHGITTPIDVVKTRIQADPEKYNQGLIGSAMKIWTEEGNQVLLRGLGPTVVGYGLEGGAKFGLYESLKPQISRLLSLDTPTIPYLIASIVAGAVAAVMICPMEKTRIRLVTDPDFASNLFTGIPRLVEESGVASLFSGLVAMLSKQVPYTFAKQVSFDSFAASLYTIAASASLEASDVKLAVSLGAAFLASILACILSHPGDVILTATYKNSGSTKGFQDAVTEIYQHQGLQGFVSGLSARFLHVGAIITSQLVLYDTIKQLLGLPATGS